MDYDAVIAAVRDRVDPDDDERERLQAVTDEVVERTEDAIAELDLDLESEADDADSEADDADSEADDADPARDPDSDGDADRDLDGVVGRTGAVDVVLVGSTARGTWVSGDRDIDVFVRFPTEIDRATLERYGLQVGHAVVPDGHEEYAEHPYVKGPVDGFDIDLVPCYAVGDATEIRSAVDRTPFHDAYLSERLTADLAADVRLAKAFLKGCGVYGSDLRTKGFSGYLTELLVVEYGGFRAFLEAARDWRPPVELDPEDHAAASFSDALVVIDPTDPERNVAAVVSETNVARVIHHARAFLDDPTVERFEPREPDPLDPDAFRAQAARRGTTPVAVVFDAPDVVADQLFPQLERSLGGLRDGLARHGFDPIRATTTADPGTKEEQWGDGILFVECGVGTAPAVERHEGPPVYVDEHARGFFDRYADDPAVWGPFVEEDRYVVEREREFTTPAQFLDSDDLFEVSHGARVASALRDGYDVLIGADCAALCETDAFAAELARFFDPEP